MKFSPFLERISDMETPSKKVELINNNKMIHPYCNGNCMHRRVNEKAETVTLISTNEKGFCKLGYTSNPKTIEASENVLLNKGQLCHHNPWKYDKTLRRKA